MDHPVHRTPRGCEEKERNIIYNLYVSVYCGVLFMPVCKHMARGFRMQKLLDAMACLECKNRPSHVILRRCLYSKYRSFNIFTI